MKNILNIALITTILLSISCEKSSKKSKAESTINTQQRAESEKKPTYDIGTAKNYEQMQRSLLNFIKSLSDYNGVEKSEEFLDMFNRTNYNFANNSNLALLMLTPLKIKANTPIEFRNEIYLKVTNVILDRIITNEVYEANNFLHFLKEYFRQGFHINNGQEVVCSNPRAYCPENLPKYSAEKSLYFPDLLKEIIEVQGQLSESDRDFIEFTFDTDLGLNGNYKEFERKLRADVARLVK